LNAGGVILEEYSTYIWLGLTILFVVVESSTWALTSVWFALGALGATIAALFGGDIWLQVMLFVLISGLSIAALRPFARAMLVQGKVSTNADRVIGREGVVTEEIDNLENRGQVLVDGRVWTARTEGEVRLSPDSTVRVLRIEGVKVIVEPYMAETISQGQEAQAEEAPKAGVAEGTTIQIEEEEN